MSFVHPDLWCWGKHNTKSITSGPMLLHCMKGTVFLALELSALAVVFQQKSQELFGPVEKN